MTTVIIKMAGTEGEDFDFSDMLGIEEGAEIKITQNGEEIKPVTAPTQEAKPAQPAPVLFC